MSLKSHLVSEFDRFDRARHKGGSGLCPQGARVADAVPLTNPEIHTHTTK